MPFTNNCVCLCCWALLGLHAQAEPLTVESAIASAKQKKSQSPVAKADTLPAGLLPPLNNNPLPIAVVDPPRLWSIKGINQNHKAEIIYNQKIFQIPLVVGGQFESWEIVAFDSDSLTLKKITPSTKAARKATQTARESPFLKLTVAPTGNPIGSYQIQRGNDINTLPRRAAADLPLAKN